MLVDAFFDIDDAMIERHDDMQEEIYHNVFFGQDYVRLFYCENYGCNHGCLLTICAPL